MVAHAVNPLGLLVLVVFLALWQLVVGAHVIRLQSLPAPTGVVRAASHLIEDGQFQHNVAHTLVAMLLGWLIAAVIALIVGSIIGLFRRVYTYTMASVDLLRAVPGVTLAPVAVLLFGFSSKMEIVLIAFVAIWPVLIATVEGTRSAPPELLEVARTLRMSRVMTVRKFVIPNALPQIVVSLRISLAVALAIAIVAELVGNPNGIGAALVQEQDTLQPASMFAYVIAAALLGLILNAILVAMVRVFSPGTHALATERMMGGRT